MALKGFPVSIRGGLSACTTRAGQPVLAPAASQPDDSTYGTDPLFRSRATQGWAGLLGQYPVAGQRAEASFSLFLPHPGV